MYWPAVRINTSPESGRSALFAVAEWFKSLEFFAISIQAKGFPLFSSFSFEEIIAPARSRGFRYWLFFDSSVCQVFLSITLLKLSINLFGKKSRGERVLNLDSSLF